MFCAYEVAQYVYCLCVSAQYTYCVRGISNMYIARRYILRGQGTQFALALSFFTIFQIHGGFGFPDFSQQFDQVYSESPTRQCVAATGSPRELHARSGFSLAHDLLPQCSAGRRLSRRIRPGRGRSSTFNHASLSARSLANSGPRCPTSAAENPMRYGCNAVANSGPRCPTSSAENPMRYGCNGAPENHVLNPY